MSEDVWTVDEAKSAFEAVIKRAQSGEPQRIVANGKTIAVVTKVEREAQVEENEQKERPSFVEHLLAIPKGGDVEFERIQLNERPVDI